MSIRTQDLGRITLHDSMNRAVPDYATPEALEAQIAQYLASGREIKQIATGVTAFTYTTRPADRERQSAGGKKGSAARTGIAERTKQKIRMEDGL